MHELTDSIGRPTPRKMFRKNRIRKGRFLRLRVHGDVTVTDLAVAGETCLHNTEYSSLRITTWGGGSIPSADLSYASTYTLRAWDIPSGY